MNYLIFTLVITMISYMIYSLTFDKLKISFEFMSTEHTSILKGLAIIMVIFSHMGHKFGIRYLAPFGGTGVAIFLITSAYGLEQSYKNRGLNQFWNNRFFKLLIPYIFIRVIYIVFSWSWPGMIRFLLDITFIKPLNPNGWYMTFILFWYVAFYIIHRIKILNKCKKNIFLLLSIILMFIPNELWAEQAFSFTVGIILSEYIYKLKSHKILNKKYVSITIAMIGVFFLCLKQVDMVRNLDPQIIYFIQLLNKFSFAIAIILFSYQLIKIYRPKFFMSIGIISYELYLIHGYFLTILDKMTYTNIIIFLAICLLCSVITVYICKYIHKTIKLKYKRNSMI